MRAPFDFLLEEPDVCFLIHFTRVRSCPLPAGSGERPLRFASLTSYSYVFWGPAALNLWLTVRDGQKTTKLSEAMERASRAGTKEKDPG